STRIVPATAIAIPAATMLYSIAVAPCSSSRKRATLIASVTPILTSIRAPSSLLSDPIDQMRDQGLVGGRHGILPQLSRLHPREPLALARRDDPVPASAHVERHQDVKLRIHVARERQRGEALLIDRNAQFLRKLADQRLFRPLARLDLAARKLPKPGHALPRRTLRDQHAAIRIHEGAGRNEEHFAHDLVLKLSGAGLIGRQRNCLTRPYDR